LGFFRQSQAAERIVFLARLPRFDRCSKLGHFLHIEVVDDFKTSIFTVMTVLALELYSHCSTSIRRISVLAVCVFLLKYLSCWSAKIFRTFVLSTVEESLSGYRPVSAFLRMHGSALRFRLLRISLRVAKSRIYPVEPDIRNTPPPVYLCLISLVINSAIPSLSYLFKYPTRNSKSRSWLLHRPENRSRRRASLAD
jgi:hypothetical protein